MITADIDTIEILKVFVVFLWRLSTLKKYKNYASWISTYMGFLDDSDSSEKMNAFCYTTRKIFSWTHENGLPYQILELCYCKVFPSRIYFTFYPKDPWGFFFIENLKCKKFNCATDKAYEIIKNVNLLAFSMFPFSIQ